jgi:hypothetical protein
MLLHRLAGILGAEGVNRQQKGRAGNGQLVEADDGDEQAAHDSTYRRRSARRGKIRADASIPQQFLPDHVQIDAGRVERPLGTTTMSSGASSSFWESLKNSRSTLFTRLRATALPVLR